MNLFTFSRELLRAGGPQQRAIRLEWSYTIQLIHCKASNVSLVNVVRELDAPRVGTPMTRGKLCTTVVYLSSPSVL